MRAAVVAEGNPVTHDSHRMLDAFETLSMRAQLVQRPDEALDHAGLWRAIRNDELLFRPVELLTMAVQWWLLKTRPFRAMMSRWVV